MGAVKRTHGKSVMEQKLKRQIKKFVQSNIKKFMLIKTVEEYVVLAKDEFDKNKLTLIAFKNVIDAELFIGENT